MIEAQKIDNSKLESVNSENITDDLYQFIMLDWKSTSLVSLRKNKMPKKLKDCVQDIVDYGLEKSQFWFSSIIPEMADRITEEKKKELAFMEKQDSKEFECLDQLNKKIHEIYETEKQSQSDENIIFFKNLVISSINKKYLYTEQLRPNYWEQFIKDYYPDKGIEAYQKNYEDKRRSAFKGMHFNEIKETQFYNNIALPFVAMRYKEEKPRIDVLTESCLDYSLKINVFKNTYELSKKLSKLRSGELLPENIENDFSDILRYSGDKSKIEKQYFEEKKRSDLTGILNKIKNKN